MIPKETPPHPLSQKDVEDFWRDGVICVRGLYSDKWLAIIEQGLAEICSKPSPLVPRRSAGAAEPKFRSDAFTWMLNDKIRDFVLFGPSAALMQQLYKSQRINFFYDQIFVKKELTPDPTPWHHDFTFWPIAGTQIASIWASVDPATPESSALEFVAGSHRWGRQFKAVGVGGYVLSTEPLEDVPNIEADRSKHHILGWDLEPGDALLFHALTLHGARGNSLANRQRRAITTRWCGDDVVFAPRGKQMPLLWNHGLQTGDKLGGFLFPQIMPDLIESEVAARLAHPIPPDAAILAAEIPRLMNLERVPQPALTAATL
jgi:ectoine hydroxylase-related dioxygenase (phytanoyl-CoA dioxygenase family)